MGGLEMDVLIGVALVIGLLFLFTRGGRRRKQGASRPRSQEPTSSSRSAVSESMLQRILNENLPWLQARWEDAGSHQPGGSGVVPSWYYDDATDRQLARIEELGLKFKNFTPNKGQASDIIGLYSQPDENDLELLRFFNVDCKEMNQSRARHAVAMLLVDPANKEAWENRPATPPQREFFRFMGWRVPKGLTYRDAEARKVDEEDEPRLEEWDALNDLWDELSDPDVREEYEIKKPSMSVFRKAWDELRSAGADPIDLRDDPDLIVEKLLELKPDLSRAD